MLTAFVPQPAVSPQTTLLRPPLPRGSSPPWQFTRPAAHRMPCPPGSASEAQLIWDSLLLSAWNFPRPDTSSSFLNCFFLPGTLLVCCPEAVNMIFLEGTSTGVVSLTDSGHGLPMAFRMKFKPSGSASLAFGGLALVYLTGTPRPSSQRLPPHPSADQ